MRSVVVFWGKFANFIHDWHTNTLKAHFVRVVGGTSNEMGDEGSLLNTTSDESGQGMELAHIGKNKLLS